MSFIKQTFRIWNEFGHFRTSVRLMTLQFYATICSPRPGCKRFKWKLYAINHSIVAFALRSDYADENFNGNSEINLSFRWNSIILQLRDARDSFREHLKVEILWFQSGQAVILFPGLKHIRRWHWKRFLHLSRQFWRLHCTLPSGKPCWWWPKSSFQSTCRSL